MFHTDDKKNWKEKNVEDIRYSLPTCILEQLRSYVFMQGNNRILFHAIKIGHDVKLQECISPNASTTPTTTYYIVLV